jgi:transposase
LVNLREAFQKLLDRLRSELRAQLPAKTTIKSGEIPLRRRRHRSEQEVAGRDERRAQRLSVHSRGQRLRRAGLDVLAIAHRLKTSRSTVYHLLSMAQFPEPISNKRLPSLLDPFVDHLSRRWTDGCRNASRLWRELRAQGYPGTRRQIAQWVYERREQAAPSTPTKYIVTGLHPGGQLVTRHEAADQATLSASRQLVWLFLKHSNQLEVKEFALRDQLLAHPIVRRAKKLAQNFQRIVRNQKPRAFDDWLQACQTAAIPELANFAIGLRKDYLAVKTALSTQWSNGQTEGQVNKLKMLKRQMYGRANFDLLRSRLLYPP